MRPAFDSRARAREDGNLRMVKGGGRKVKPCCYPRKENEQSPSVVWNRVNTQRLSAVVTCTVVTEEMQFIEAVGGGWEDGSQVKRVQSSCRGLEFRSQDSHWEVQLHVTLAT